jgi:hypothetical protein
VGHEGAFHSIDEYMKYAIDYFNVRSTATQNSTNSLKKRKVYLASDEPGIFEEAKQKYKLSKNRNQHITINLLVNI